ncbi:MAG: NAD-dependent epimerase/dehydratase family protein [Nitrosomonas sp.]|nr:NAD-dependent epimerase/dehydratase family protein [Nitrosomonas sp.]
MDKRHIGLLGATSLVGECILNQLVSDHWQIVAFSRQVKQRDHPQINWVQLNSTSTCQAQKKNKIALWICTAPIWILPEHFSLLLACGVQRIVMLSSTSRFSKTASVDPDEQVIAQQLIQAEKTIEIWATEHHIEWIILRPTLIYGLGRDKNISEIAWFILRFGFFPLFGTAQGLRQPIHAKDVSTACILALNTLNLKNCTYNLTGGETLTYCEMIKRIFSALNKDPRLIRIPFWLFRLTITILRWFPRYRNWSVAMAKRMNQDLVFDCLKTQRDLHFSPRQFTLSKEDLPSIKQRF